VFFSLLSRQARQCIFDLLESRGDVDDDKLKQNEIPGRALASSILKSREVSISCPLRKILVFVFQLALQDTDPY
jgi:hypothetical protein